MKIITLYIVVTAVKYSDRFLEIIYDVGEKIIYTKLLKTECVDIDMKIGIGELS